MSANDLPINFSYARWTPNTHFKLCNVPWDMGYRDIVKWSKQAQREYFDRLDGIEFSNCTMAKYGLPVRLPRPRDFTWLRFFIRKLLDKICKDVYNICI